jgi:hypothetical protein
LLLTLSILRLNSVPDPFSGVKSFEKADMRRVLIVPGPVLRMFAETFQLVAVSPAEFVYGDEKVTIAESKVKSPWKPIRLSLLKSVVVVTGSMITVAMGTELSKMSVGRDTVIGDGVGVVNGGNRGTRGSGG